MEISTKIIEIYKELYDYNGELDMLHTLLETNKSNRRTKEIL